MSETQKITKAQAIRDYLESNPTATKEDVVSALAAGGIDVLPAYVRSVMPKQTSKSALISGSKEKTKKKSSKKKKPGKKRKKPASATAKFPRHTVEQALRIPKAILEQNAGRPCTSAQAAAYVGVGVHGPFRLEVSSAIKYGLIERVEKNIKPTDLARQILRPQSKTDEVDGYRQAIRNAPTLGKVYEHYRGENLPDDKFLKNTSAGKFAVPSDKFLEFKRILLHNLEKAELVEKKGDQVRIVDTSSDVPQTSLVKAAGHTLSSRSTCFVMQPFAPPLGDYYRLVYEPAIRKAGLIPVRADDDIFGTGKIIEQVWNGIQAAEILVAELTSRNPNVFYELGLAHALGKPVVLVTGAGEDVPFDLRHIRTIYYDTSDPFWGEKLTNKVAENITSALLHPEEAVLTSILKSSQ